MARTSFTLRKTTTDQGSYLQYPPTYDTSASATYPIRSTDDTFLRADGLQLSPGINSIIPGNNQYYAVGTFTVTTVNYDQVHITWSLPITTTPGATPEVTEVLLVYSDQGEPDVINDGSILIQTSTDSEIYHTVNTPGWAYYTLFLKYQSSTGDLYYEPGAKLSTLIPTNYDSSGDLFAKIPLYYRLLDDDLDTGNGGPLERFLGVFGWDTDRLRAVIDYLMVCKDPQEARSQELNNIAKDLGIDLRSDELGAARLRAFLNDIGQIRRSNGTENSLLAALTALTGSIVTLNDTTKTIYIRPQRVNFIKDPRIASGLSTSLDGGTATIDSDVAVDGGTWASDGATNQTEYSTSTGGPASVSYTISSTGYWNAYVVVADPTYSILQTNTADIVVYPDTTYYFSTHCANQTLITQVTLDDTSVSPRVNEIVATNANRITVGNRYYWKLYIPSDYTGASTLALGIKYETQTSISADNLFDNLLLEENNIGQFFDGNTKLGGWLVDPNGDTMSDFKWAYYAPIGSTEPVPSPINEASFSIYTSNYTKTKHVVNRLLPTLLPVNELVTSGTVYSNRPITVNNYTVVWDYVPGYTLES